MKLHEFFYFDFEKSAKKEKPSRKDRWKQSQEKVRSDATRKKKIAARKERSEHNKAYLDKAS